jgi:uncharacterized protein
MTTSFKSYLPMLSQRPGPWLARRSAWLWAALAAFGLSAAALAQPSAQPAAAPQACPPTAQMPTPEQLQAAQARARDSYLFGTIHMGNLDWAMPGPNMRAALMASEIVAVELDLTDPALMQSMQQSITAGAAANPAPALSAEQRSRIARQTALACLPEGALNALHPVMQAVTLTLLDARWLGLDAGFAQEIVLGGFARASQRPIHSLETVQSQSSALVPKDPREATRMVEQMLKQLEDGTARRVMQRMAAIWEQGQLDDLAQYERWCECAVTAEEKAFLKRLNDDRNPALADGIDKLHMGGKRVFAAVGALHMTGPQAIPALLQAKGYTVQRVAAAKP